MIELTRVETYKVNNMRNLVYIIMLAISLGSTAYPKVKVVLEERDELAYLENHPSCEVGDKAFTADEDTIEYESGNSNNKTVFPSNSKYSPAFKMYDNEKLTGKIAGELTKEGLFINGEKRCGWSSNSPCAGKFDSIEYCILGKHYKDEGTFDTVECDLIKKNHSSIKIDKASDNYFMMKIEGKDFYISRKNNPQYKYVASPNKRAEESKQALFNKINKNFKKHQNDFLEYVEQQKKCFKNKDEKCMRLNGLDLFTSYLCYDNKLNCPEKVGEWGAAKKDAKEYYYASAPECFDFSEMKIDVAKYKTEGQFQIYTVLKGYDRNVVCAYYIKMYEDKKDDIYMNFYVRVQIPETMYEREDGEFVSAKLDAREVRQCDLVLGKSKIIPSRLHDKSFKKME